MCKYVENKRNKFSSDTDWELFWWCFVFFALHLNTSLMGAIEKIKRMTTHNEWFLCIYALCFFIVVAVTTSLGESVCSWAGWFVGMDTLGFYHTYESSIAWYTSISFHFNTYKMIFKFRTAFCNSFLFCWISKCEIKHVTWKISMWNIKKWRKKTNERRCKKWINNNNKTNHCLSFRWVMSDVMKENLMSVFVWPYFIQLLYQWCKRESCEGDKKNR